jgi:hypothetical protein
MEDEYRGRLDIEEVCRGFLEVGPVVVTVYIHYCIYTH